MHIEINYEIIQKIYDYGIIQKIQDFALLTKVKSVYIKYIICIKKYRLLCSIDRCTYLITDIASS